MLDTVLLELEGVIADTGEARHDAIVAALHADGVNLPENDYRDLCAGLSFEDAIRAAFHGTSRVRDETAVALAAHRAERAYRAYIGKGLTLVEGARETLERLHDTVRLALVTRSPRDDASRRSARWLRSARRGERDGGGDQDHRPTGSKSAVCT